MLGPDAPHGPPCTRTVACRRYRCALCRAVVTVVPRGVLARLRYGLIAIAQALAMHGHDGVPGWQARNAVSPLIPSGDERHHGWRSLTRWTLDAAIAQGLYIDATAPPRVRAASIATQLAARAPIPTGVVSADAVLGALAR